MAPMLQKTLHPDLSVFILSGGLSSRMGTPKAFLPVGGRELIDRAIAIGKRLTNKVYISANSTEYDSYGLPVIKDLYADCGPLGGIYSCLRASTTQNNIFLPCDAPFLTSDVFQKLLENTGNADIVTLKNNEVVEPFASVFSKNVTSAVQTAIENHQLGLIRFIKNQNTRYVDLEENLQDFAFSFFNCNTPSELKTAQQLHRNSLPFVKNMVIVAGGGRNTGKTTVAEKLIKQFSSHLKILSLKVSPHFHHPLEDGMRFRISEENEINRKDSSKLLQAGAYKSLYAECQDDELPGLVGYLESYFRVADLIIAESAGLANLIKPAVLIYCEADIEKQKNQWLRDIADVRLGYDTAEKECFHESVVFTNNSFTIKTNADDIT